MKIPQSQINYTDIFLDMVRCMFGHDIADANRTEKGSKEAYECIPLNALSFCNGVQIILSQNTGIKSFIDVGCGLAEKVFLAKQLFDLEASGVELRRSYIPRAIEVIGRYTKAKVDIFQGDARFQDYSKYDLIYFFRPAPSEEIEYDIEIQIAKTAKKGAVVFGNLPEIFSTEHSRGIVADLKLLGWEEIRTQQSFLYWKRIQNTPFPITFDDAKEAVEKRVKNCRHSLTRERHFFFSNDDRYYFKETDKTEYFTLTQICEKHNLVYHEHIK